MNEKRKVYIVAKGLHSWTAAEQYGELVFLSTSPIGRTGVSNMVRLFAPKLKGSDPEDYIIITGLTVMCSIACTLFALRHKRLNLLLFDAAGDKYVKRVLMLDDLEQVEQELNESYVKG